MTTQQYVKELFEYCETGNLIWRVDRGNNKVKGIIAGTLGQNNRIIVYIDNKPYLLHILIWLYHKGYMPHNTIDHKDCNPLNNKIENLREATLEQQNFNKPARKNKILPKWVSYHPPKNGRKERYEARVTLNKKTHNLGSFSSAEEAYNVASKFAKEYQGEFYNEN